MAPDEPKEPEEIELLKKSVELAEDNNKILLSIRRHLRISRTLTLVYWVFIIGSILGALYFIQPYVDQISELYGGAKNNLNSFGEMFQGSKQ